MRLRDIRRSDIERVLEDLAKPLDGGRPLGNVGRRVTRRSPATVESYRKTIRAALAVAQRRELIPANPALGTLDSIPRPTADEDDDPVIWEMEDTARFLEHVMDDRLSALYELAAYAGLRRAELCGLRWSDLDPDGGGVTVRLTNVCVTRKEVTPEQAACPICGAIHVGRLLKRPKSRAGRRWVPLAKPAQEALARHRVAQKERRIFSGRTTTNTA
jgi:integrase